MNEPILCSTVQHQLTNTTVFSLH